MDVELVSRMAVHVTKRNELEADIKALQEKCEAVEGDIRDLFVPVLAEVYRDWRPRLREVCALLCFDHSPPMAIGHIVREVDGIYVRTSELPDSTSYHRTELQLSPDEYESAMFVVPWQVYEQLASQIQFKYFERPQLKELRERGIVR